jgi:hypothetical protein
MSYILTWSGYWTQLLETSKTRKNGDFFFLEKIFFSLFFRIFEVSNNRGRYPTMYVFDS